MNRNGKSDHFTRRIGAFALAAIIFCTVILATPSLSSVAMAAENTGITEGMELIADFNFDNEATGLVGAGAKANPRGTASYSPGQSGSQAANISSNFWLEVTKENGSPLLAGLDEIVISYDSNPSTASSNLGWAVFATRTVRAPKNAWESYLGILDKSTSIGVERFHNAGSRPSGGLTATPAAGWRHIDVVISKTTSKLYVNGVLKNIQPSNCALSEILSASGGFLYIGKSTWGSGEYFTGQIDNFKIYKPAALDDTSKVAAAKTALALPYDKTERQVYGNITLPKSGLNGTTITWKTDKPEIVDVNEYLIENYDPKPAGTVTRPAEDTIVTMTATISSGAVSDTKEFQFTVKKAPAPLEDTEAYIFTFFTGSEGSPTDEQIYFATSTDGTNWTDMTSAGNPILTSTVGELGVRDPYILRSPEGDKFYLIATDLSINRRGGWGSSNWSTGSTGMVIWESTDLVNWGAPRLIDIAGAVPDAGNLWAPEAIYDEVTGEYFVFWATLSTVSNNTGDAQNMYYSRTRDFYTFTKPTLWIDEQNSIIDTSMIKVGNTFYRASGNGQISIDKSTSLTGNWDRISTLSSIFNTSNYSGAKLEGPELFLYNEKDWLGSGATPTWGLMCDQYAEGKGYLPFRTTNIADTTKASWSIGSDIKFGAVKKRHGSIMTVTKSEYDAIMEKYYVPDAGGSGIDVSKMQVIADFNFNELPSSGNASIAGGDAVAKVNGTVSRSSDTPDGVGYSANISNNFWLNLTKNDSTPLLAGLDEIVISYDSKPNSSSNAGWTFFAAPNTSTQSYQQEHYLGVLDTTSNVTVERYNNSGSRPGNNLSGTSSSAWKHVDIVVNRSRTSLYINGKLVSSNSSAYKLSDILTSSGGIIQIGKANWVSGEYYRGLMDNLKIYSSIQLLTDVKADPSACTTITNKMDMNAKKAELYISRNNSQIKDLTAVPLTFALRPDAQIVDPQDTYDLTNPVTITATYGDITETWTISATMCNNPVLPGQYADPDIDMFNGKYYIYPTTDGFEGWGGYQFKVFSSDDMVDWVDEGVILDLRATESYKNENDIDVAVVPWSNGNAWAPAIEEKNGKYYFYFCGNNTAANSKAIGVAVADSPAGPFTVKETPLLTIEECRSAGISMGQVIDPAIFTEDDGTSYMLFGNGNPAIVQLGEDMMSWVPGTMKNYVGANSFREAIEVKKIDGLYHFTWSCDDTGSENYQVRYGVSDSLYGPIQYKYPLLQKDTSMDIKGTGHHSILYIPERDEYYIAYHRFVTPLGKYTSGFGFHRETCIEKLEYKDGLFQIVKPTLTGITEPVLIPSSDVDGTTFSLDKLEPNATLSATTCFINNGAQTVNGRVVLAVYDSQNKLIALNESGLFSAESDGRVFVDTSVVLPSDVTGLTVKAFVWNSEGVPLRNVALFK